MGDLISCQLMASYHEEHQFTRFSNLDMLNFSVNIYQDGNILEICTNSGMSLSLSLTLCNPVSSQVWYVSLSLTLCNPVSSQTLVLLYGPPPWVRSPLLDLYTWHICYYISQHCYLCIVV